ncbi:MATE family efflux transporter [Rhodohalobacter sp. 614A]|uniref:MATE family efflux transporter n=1 Tax=Rhodohalobacter sp. 614A TaxID=2908649 RepID=UPI001F19B8F3|nr:MATE family efflux transporter [Rhodohalobacter sp. 614A]
MKNQLDESLSENLEPSKQQTLWQDIVGSVKGMEYDFTSGSTGRAILLLSIPMVLEMMMESVFAVADIFFVSKLGPEAVATVGITESIMTILYAVAMGLSMGTTALVSRRIGEKNNRSASIAAVQSVLIGIVVSIPVALLGIFLSHELLGLMGASETIITEMYTYTMIMMGGNIVIMLLFIVNAVFRGAGDAAISMRVLWFANLLNIILDPILIFGLGPVPAFGIAGAAIATTLARGLGVIYQFWVLAGKNSRIKIDRHDLKLNLEVMSRLVKVSMGGIGQFLISTASWVGMVRIIAEFGSTALAGYTIAIRIVMFSLLPSWGMSNAAATLVGQNLGAGKPGRAERSAWVCGFVNTGFLVLLGISFYLFSDQLIRLFTPEIDVIAVGAKALKIIAIGYLFYGMGMVMVQAFNGAGDTVTPTWLNFICFWLIEIPLAWFLSMNIGLNENGVFWSIVIAESTFGMIAMWIFTKGKWKGKEV